MPMGENQLILKTVFKCLLSSFIFLEAADLHAACLVQNSNSQETTAKGDVLFALLQTSVDCPKNVQSLKNLIDQAGLSSQAYMVANRGIHNPAFGSFSLFEEVKGTSPLLKVVIGAGEFFFGHFTAAENGQVIADQEPSKGKLLVELIAWDHIKNLFNFYELIGTGNGAQWFYRGDSGDVLADNALVFLNPQGPKFGSRLRCSACHASGGPIMKEISAPHNDWWTVSRPLNFGPHRISLEMSSWVKKLGDANDLSQSVKSGIARLEASPDYQAAKLKLSFQVTLRPLFCETEVNLESDSLPLDQRLNQTANSVLIPSSSIVNPLLVQRSMSMTASAYRQLLSSSRMQFPETNRSDADHGWLVPVKGYSDLFAIQSLIKNGVVTEEFVADVLSIDLESPLFSSKRCGLLRLVPHEGLDLFPDQLKSSSLPGASELHENLTNPTRTRSFHVQKAQDLMTKTQAALKTADGQAQIFKNLIEARQAVFNSEISKNPRGQILEPGFRVIFPMPQP